MSSPQRATRAVSIAFAGAVLLISADAAQASTSCKSITNPYAGSRYEGVPLSHIRAKGVSCKTARSVVKGAHYKALGLTPPSDGVRRFGWHGWKVKGDLAGDSDHYTATKGSNRVTWRF